MKGAGQRIAVQGGDAERVDQRRHLGRLEWPEAHGLEALQFDECALQPL